MNAWWDDDPRERYWLEVTDRTDLGADLHAPKLDDAGRSYWSYNLVTEVRDDDIVLHWHKSLMQGPGIVGWSTATGAPEDSTIVWQARGTYGRAHGPTGREPSWRMPLTGYTPLLTPIYQGVLRREEHVLREIHTRLTAEHGTRPLYFPFAFSDRRPIRTSQGYLFKFPAALLDVFPELARLPGTSRRRHPPRSTPRPRRSRGDAGYLSDPRVRSAIERHAVERAIAYFTALGYLVEDVGHIKPYDLLVSQGTESRHVEVKGSTGNASTVELTEGEVKNALDHQPTDLFIVDGIAWQREPDGSIRTEGGTERVLHDWSPAIELLTPTRYRYRIPEGW